MFNDQVMMLYLLIGLFHLFQNKPITSICWITLALSVKAGVMLVLPALLGSIQFNFGTRTLLKCMTILVGFQILVSLPFILTETTIADYLERSKLTGAGRNGIGFAEPYFDYLAAHQTLTIFWRFVPENFYYDPEGLAKHCKIGIVALNIYHFFIRKGALITCLTNLKDFLTGNQDKPGVSKLKQLQWTIQTVVIGYFVGIILMPGAHGQFAFWFTPLVPLLTDMVGLPQIFTIWIYQYLYPPLPEKLNIQHVFLLCLVCWLITVGPKK